MIEIVNVIVAAAVAYGFGAVWYMAMAGQWMAASGVEVGPDGRPANAANKGPYVVAFVAMLIVAGMMRHMFGMAGIDTVAKGFVGGIGIGAFIVVPWVATHYCFSGRPVRLIVIDGVYNIAGCGLIGLVLTLF